jgi:exosortase
VKVENLGPRPLYAILCGGACVALFQFWGNATHGYIASDSLFYWWGFQWVNPDSENEHAWLVLALSVFLLWRNLRRDNGDQQSDGIKSAAALALGLLLHALCFVAQQPRLSIAALLLCIWGVLVLGGGRRWGRASAFPVAFLAFAIPVNALDTLGFWLRMWVVRAGGQIANLLGIAVLRNGTQLISPDGRYQYDVAAACSGIRSLMALAALSLFISYLRLRPAWLRCAVLLLSMPLVYLGNVLRILIIVIAAQWGGQAWGDRVHEAMGFVVFMIVVVGVIAIAEAIARFRPDWATGNVDSLRVKSPGPRAGLGSASIAAAVILSVVVEAALLSHRLSVSAGESPGVILAGGGANPAELPAFIGSEWIGRHVEPTKVERTILPPDTGFSRRLYVNLDTPGRRVLLSIVLSGRDRSSIHRPELCLVGQGWTIDGSSTHRFSYPGRARSDFDGTVLKVHRELAGPGGARRLVPELVAYWFVGDGRIVHSQFEMMFCDAWDRIFLGRATRWAYILLQTGADDGEDAGLARIQSVLSATLPSFQPAITAHPSH